MAPGQEITWSNYRKAPDRQLVQANDTIVVYVTIHTADLPRVASQGLPNRYDQTEEIYQHNTFGAQPPQPFTHKAAQNRGHWPKRRQSTPNQHTRI